MLCHESPFPKIAQFPHNCKIFSTLSTHSSGVTGIPSSGPVTFGYESRKEAEDLQKYKLVHRNSQASVSLSMYKGIMKQNCANYIEIPHVVSNIFREKLKIFKLKIRLALKSIPY